MEKQLVDLNKRINRLKEEKNGLIKLLSVGKITDEEYQSVANSNNEEIHRIQEQKSGLEATCSSNVVNDIGRLKSEIQLFMKLEQLSTDMLHRLVEKVEVNADGTPQIYYRFAAATAFN